MDLANRPRTRQRAYKKPPVLDVPDIDQDAAERKRVLNVLAQRRYREKKRMSRLKAKSIGNSVTQNSGPGSEPEPCCNVDGESFGDDVIEVPRTLQDDAQFTNHAANMAMPATTGDAADMLAGLDFSLASWGSLPEIALPSILPDVNILPEFLCEESTSDEVSAEAPSGLATGFGGPDLTTFHDIPSFSTSPAASTESFPDSYNLPVLQLALLKGVIRIADRLNCKQGLWDLDGNSAFVTGVATPAALLPANWQPTPLQTSVSHHPVFDLLPWPGVRNRVISILSLPDGLRPPRARGELACVNFAYDLEDTAEGVRIHGEDPYDPGSWELGQIAFEKWWFLFDNTIINTSNRWRRARGAPPLLRGSSEGSTKSSSATTSPAMSV
ncbi:hypothetical protein FLAG1_00681 [Fusarium langsethiae]|uniref:BZIP domain-containing protein n=1 Tax=Fusarium langsethiae TaxID=179993 RepID=A0A0M9F545_FUSLA|nr:hypothetical protein FLAG1_00681 [Fusarium langsethiae]GKT98900.1 unnamed protein product [Fusarium langsethiae]GKU14413.1 unnamed protein product [Fusarium langsethiae]